jgi:hypothetical protein
VQDLKNKPDELNTSKDIRSIFEKYADLKGLPDELFCLLPNYLKNIEVSLVRAAEILKAPRPQYSREGEIEINMIRTVATTYLSTPGLYTPPTDHVVRNPEFSKYDNVLTEEFFFI